MDEESELKHYGTKGMRWGIRRDKRKEKNQKIKDARETLYNDKKRSAKIDAAKRNLKNASPESRAEAKALVDRYAKENRSLRRLADQRTSGERKRAGLYFLGVSGVMALRIRYILNRGV